MERLKINDVIRPTDDGVKFQSLPIAFSGELFRASSRSGDADSCFTPIGLRPIQIRPKWLSTLSACPNVTRFDYAISAQHFFVIRYSLSLLLAACAYGH